MHLFHKHEKLGEISVIVSALFFSVFPVMIHYTSDKIPPAFFAGVSALVTAALMLALMIGQGRLGELKIKKAWPALLMVTLFIMVIPYPMIYIGTGYTSGINTGLLLSMEIFFALIITGLAGERITVQKWLGALITLTGAFLKSAPDGQLLHPAFCPVPGGRVGHHADQLLAGKPRAWLALDAG